MTSWMNSWSNFLNENKKPIIKEVTDEQVELVDAVMHLPPEELPFNNMFKGKKRLLFPISVPSPELDDLVSWIGGNITRDFDISAGTLTINKQTMKIGKFMKKVLSTAESYEKLKGEINTMTRKQRAGEEQPDHDEVYNSKLKQSDKIRSSFFKNYDFEITYLNAGRVRDLYNWWTTPTEDKIAPVEYYRKRPEAVEGEENIYSLVLTRHPIDVMRMADFKNIQTCHSPTDSYFKCAVAEAQGIGLVAYIVENSDLEEELGEGYNIDDWDDDEMFFDPDRVVGAGDLTPISRLRLRNYETPYGDIAVPEDAIYGRRIPKLTRITREWARENQKEVYSKLKREHDLAGAIDMSEFVLKGGTYQDTGHKGLFSLFLDVPQRHSFVGDATIDRETEEEVVQRMGGNLESIAGDIIPDWNRRMGNVMVEYTVDDDYDDGQYLDMEVTLKYVIDADKFQKPVQYDSASGLADEIREYGYDWAHDERILSGGTHNTVWVMVDLSAVPGIEYHHPNDRYSLEETLDVLDAEVDSKREVVEEIMETFFKREGLYGGGAVMDLAMEIDNREFVAGEWDIEYDTDWPDTYEITAKTAMYDVDWSPLLDAIEVKLTMETVQQTAPSSVIVSGFGLVGDLTPIIEERDGQEGIVGWKYDSTLTNNYADLNSVDAIKTFAKRDAAMAILDRTLGMSANIEFRAALKLALAENTYAYEKDQVSFPNMNVLAGTDSDGEGHLRVELSVDVDDGDAAALFLKEMVEDNDDEDEIIAMATKAALKALQKVSTDQRVSEAANSLKQHFNKFGRKLWL